MIEMGFSSLPPFQVNYYFCAGSACAGWPCAGCFAGGVPPRFCSHVQPPRFRRHANLVWHLLTALIRTRPTQQWERVPQNPWNFGRSSRSSTALTIELLHRNRDVRVPGDVNLVANLNLIEHGRIDDMPSVFPSVRTNEGDRRGRTPGHVLPSTERSCRTLDGRSDSGDLPVHQRLSRMRSGEPISDPRSAVSPGSAGDAAGTLLPHAPIQAFQPG